MFKPQTATSRIGTALRIGTLFCLGITSATHAADYKNTRAYKDAFSCGKESLQTDPSGNSTVSYCIGNSRDPSKVELQAFKDAVAEVKGAPKAKKSQ
jgi:hypothetical protein